MLIAIRQFSSSLSSFGHLTRVARPKRRKNTVGFPAQTATSSVSIASGESSGSVAAPTPTPAAAAAASAAAAAASASVGGGALAAASAAVISLCSNSVRRVHSCASVGQIDDGGLPRTTQSRTYVHSKRPRQAGLEPKLSESMEPTVAEYFPDVEKQHVFEVTSGAHPIVEAAFEKLLDSVANSHDARLSEFSAWIRRVIEYNVPQGKRNRLVAVMLAYQSLETKQSELTADKLEKAALLGWCVELLQAFFLICDDIMDNSLTRRGRHCWYRVEGVNMMAINDAILCEAAIYQVLRAFFRTHPNYVDMMELFHEVLLQTATGQSLDLLAERKGGNFTQETYDAIVLYKTAYYSFSLPIRLGMYLAGIADDASHKKCETLALRIGHIFQVQDDYLDCYGDPDVIGKVGTDIADAKCSWLVVKALQIATPQERDSLLSVYGKGDPGGTEEAEVKKIYDKLKLHETFREAEEQAFALIRADIESLEHADTALKSDIFKLLVNKIYRRRK